MQATGVICLQVQEENIQAGQALQKKLGDQVNAVCLSQTYMYPMASIWQDMHFEPRRCCLYTLLQFVDFFLGPPADFGWACRRLQRLARLLHKSTMKAALICY